MADFTLVAASGVSVEEWLDPTDGDNLSRLNPRLGQPQRRFMGTVGVQIVLNAVVGGTTAPLDSALEGRLFVPFVVQQPVGVVDTFTTDSGQSSVARVTPTKVGHYHFRVRRWGGGIVHMHVDVVAAEP